MNYTCPWSKAVVVMAMSKAQLEARVKELETQLETQESPSVITFKVSQKAAVSVYGLGRFPVTLYQSQWEHLLEHQEDLKAFIKANKAKLATKKG